MKLRNILIVIGLVTAAAAPAWAAERAGVSHPDTAQVAGKTLVLNGLGVREATILNVDVYVAALYLPARTSNAQQILSSNDPKKLVLKFVRDVGRADVVNAWNEGFANNAGNVAPLRERINKLNSWMTDMPNRGTLAFTYEPGVGVKVEVNGVNKGTIAGEDFARALFSIWLGPKPPNAGLKRGLLGTG